MTLGTLVGGRYRLGAAIGQGGMGVVYRAFDEELERSLAVKLVEPTDSSHLIRWFLRGARLAQQIQHPNVVETYDHGRLENGGAFLVMELVEGIDFDTIIPSPLPLAYKLHLLTQVLDALAHVHARGVLHRDIKPENILLLREPSGKIRVKVTDFGLAALYDQRGPKEDGFDEADKLWVTGTPYYMAPERIDENLPLGPASDLYSVGVILYRLISGDLPFPQPGVSGLYLKRTQEAPAIFPLGVESSLVDLTKRAIRLHMEDRYRVAADIIRDLESHQSSFVLSPDHWIALAPELLNKSFAEEETIATQANRSSEQLETSRNFLSNPAFWERDSLRKQLEQIAKNAEGGQGGLGLLIGLPGAGGAEIVRSFATNYAQTGRFTVLSGTFEEVAGGRPGLRQALESHLLSSTLDRHRLRRFLWMQRKQLGLEDQDDLKSLINFLRPTTDEAEPQPNLQNEVFAVFVRTLRALASERPVLLALEGLGQGGELSAAFLEFLIFELAFEPFPVLCLGSSGLLNFHAEFAERLARTDRHENRLRHSFYLEPLKREVLQGHLARCFDISTQNALRVAEESAGLPSLATALAEFFASSDSHPSTGDSPTVSALDLPYRLSRPLVELVMETVTRRLSGREDSEELLWLLSGVAVLGDEVSLSLLEQMAEDQFKPDEFDDHLDALIGLKLLNTRGDLGQRTVRLEPAILRRALLSGDPDGFRDLHRRAALVRSRLHSSATHQEFGAVGDHFAAAGDIPEAQENWLRASEFEAQHGDALVGASFGLKALESMTAQDLPANALAIRLGRALLDAGSPSRAKEVLNRVLHDGKPDDILLAGEVLADLHENYGESEAWKDLLEHMSRQEEEASPTGRRALLRTRSMWLNSYGKSDQALRDAQAALDGAVDGAEVQRGAQRLVYCCLSTGDLAQAEQAARQALSASGQRVDLRVRSLRALGVVLTWSGRPSEGAEAQQEALKLCRQRGLSARTPIALHDLADAWRLSGRLRKAEEAYAQAIRTGEELVLNHTIELSRVKQVMCQLERGQTEGAVQRLRRLAPRAVSAGLGLALPFCALLESWAHALDKNQAGSLEAIDRVGDIQAVAVDPSIPDILETIASSLNGPSQEQKREELLDLAASLKDLP